MLQPRRCSESGTKMISFFVLAVLLAHNQVLCQGSDQDAGVEVDRAKRDTGPENRDLTVLLLNDKNRDYNTKVGRYHNVKPLIGLITSTARTFIQDGVTTEYATQILGTTLDNGRIYAQVLTKSSLVLYSKPQDDVVVKPTNVNHNFDSEWNVKQDLGFIDPVKFVLKNTDYVEPTSKMSIVYASKPIDKYWNSNSDYGSQTDNQVEEPTGRRVQQYNEIPRYSEHEAWNDLDSTFSRKLNNDAVKINTPLFIEKNDPDTRIEVRYETSFSNESKVSKVKPDYELPTFTIKNEFSPLFYYIDNVESRGRLQSNVQSTKVPKKLFGQTKESRPKKTLTYAGFADFTTEVGDAVIIFTPNTAIPQVNDDNGVDVVPSVKPVNKLSSKITTLAADIPIPTATFKNKKSQTTNLVKLIKNDNRSDKALSNNKDDLEKVLYEVDRIPDMINVQYNDAFDFNMDVIQPSEAPINTAQSTRLTEDLEVIPLYNSKATEPLQKVTPSATTTGDHQESVMESDFITTTESEEDMDVTEEEIAFTNDLPPTTEKNVPDSGEETHEDFPMTTESDKSEDVICTNGIAPISTMTTAYKTLTYLTTYFIPIEGTEDTTTTSIKSEVIIESSTGYLTNYDCKTLGPSIKPTAVLYETTPTLLASEKDQNEEVLTEPKSEKTAIKSKEKVIPITLSDNKIKSKTMNTTETITEEHTTTDRSTTTIESRVEMTITEQANEVTTEKQTSVKDSDTLSEESSEEDNIENEIDLIYKSLFTTYTYFTTFFHGSTSSIASHKSVVTNVVTIDSIDPTMLAAFEEKVIAPTSVGIGRPTEAIYSVIDLFKNKDVIESVEGEQAYSSQTPTPMLSDESIKSIKPDVVSTFFTTYTFFTTIFVGNDANICSRSEIYTNFVGPVELLPTKTSQVAIESTKKEFDFRNCKQIKKSDLTVMKVIQDNNSFENNKTNKYHSYSSIIRNHSQEEQAEPSPVETDMLLSIDSNPLNGENIYTTDVKSSYSKGERKFIENNNVYEDQISSESNIEEIVPSPTLLLQTSFTTFTYFTTMYIGKDSSNIKSRLETITNVVTETLTPKKDTESEENLPITYYTTFTYWTTLYKDKSMTITSREEIISNIVTPTLQVAATVSPIDTTPIDIENVLPPKDLDVEIKPTVLSDGLDLEDEKNTYYTTYTYFTTFYVGNTSQIRSSLETVTNIVDSTKDPYNENQLARSIGKAESDKNLVDGGEKLKNAIKNLKEEIKPTKLPEIPTAFNTVLSGTYIDNLYTEVKPKELEKESNEKKIIYSQVAVISGDSTIVTNDSEILKNETSTTEKYQTPTHSPDNIESPVSDITTTTEGKSEGDNEQDSEDEDNTRTRSRLSFQPKKPTFTPVIRPFSSRNRPTFSPKRVALTSSALTITRSEFTPTITATPTLKTPKTSGFGGNRKQSASAFVPSVSSTRRFAGRGSSSASLNSASAIRQSGGGFRNKPEIQPTSKRSGFRSSSIRSNTLESSSRARIRPTASIRLRGGRQSVSVPLPPVDDSIVNESETQQEFENSTELSASTSEATTTKSNSLSRFRRPQVRVPGTSVTPRTPTTSTTKKAPFGRSRSLTTTQRITTRSTQNPLFAARSRQRPNALFPRRGLFKQPELQEEEQQNNQQDANGEQVEELADGEGLIEDNDYESSDRREEQVATTTTSTAPPKKSPNTVQIRPFGFRRRTRRQADYGSRKYSNFRRPSGRSVTRAIEQEPETEPPTTVRSRSLNRFSSRTNFATARSTTTTASSRPSGRQPFILRGESRTSAPTTVPTFRGRTYQSRSSTSTRPKPPRLNSYNSQTERPRSSSRTNRGRTRGTSRTNNRQRTTNDFGTDSKNYVPPNDGKITVTHHIPTELTIPVVNGKITEYKNILTAKPSVEVLLENQYSTSQGPLGPQLVLASVSSIVENGATKLIKYVLHETPTSGIVFTPTTIRGRKTSYSHVVPSTVYNVEAVTSTVAPDINSNVPLANLLLSQLLLGNPQQQQINPLLALQGQGLLPQQPVPQTPVTELKTKTTTYVTLVTDARETVLPITFRGKEILTTIADPTVNTITATEYIIETVVSTPTVFAPQPQLNSLLLPILLQQQQQQQQILQHPNILAPNNILGQPDLSLLQNNNNFNNELFNSPKPNILDVITSNEEYSEEYSQDGSLEEERDELPPPPPPPRPVKNRPRPPKPSPPKITNVVTLYVSGRTPGEFSTVLSTVVSDDTQTVRKREAIYFEDVYLSSNLPSIEELFSSQSDNALENLVLSNDKGSDESIESQLETQSLESILGEVKSNINASPTFFVNMLDSTTVNNSDGTAIDKFS